MAESIPFSPQASTSTASSKGHKGNPTLCSRHNIIQEKIDELAEKLKENWEGKIFFTICPSHHLESKIGAKIVDTNICNYFHNETYHNKLYFDKDTYPRLKEGPGICQSFYTLKNDLERAAMKSGSPIHSNGGGKDRRRFTCSQCTRRRKTVDKNRDCRTDVNYRESSLVSNDKRNRRLHGKSLERKTTTTYFEFGKCPFSFSVKWDKLGYYISLAKNGGCSTHKYHPPVDPAGISFPTRLIPPSELKNLERLANSAVSYGVGRNFFYSKHGEYITNQKISYLFNQRVVDDNGNKTDIQKLLEYFEQHARDLHYHCLWDIIPNDSKATPNTESLNYPHLSPSKLFITTATTETDVTGDLDLQYFRREARFSRESNNLDDEGKVFVGCAWVIQKELRYFKLFPEVLCIDGTSHSSKRKLLLLTLSVRTSTNRQVVFMRLFMPNEKRATFRWVFKYVLPSLVDKSFFKRTRYIMADGDAQQKNEVLGAIQTYIPNAILGGCGWHIVDRGWLRGGFSNKGMSPTQMDKWNIVRKTIFSWIYSWMRPGFVESESEYIFSKRLLNKYINSKTVIDSLNGDFSKVHHIVSWLRSYVFIHENEFLFYRRKNIRHFDISHNSIHEGTNFGMKNHASNIRPDMSMHITGERLTLQGNLKHLQLETESVRDYTKKKLWSDLPTSRYIVHLAEGILLTQSKQVKNYDVRWVDESNFEVTYQYHAAGNTQSAESSGYILESSMETNASRVSMAESKKPPSAAVHQILPSDSPIPIFKHVRRVYSSKDGVFYCSCGGFERTGIPCIHINSVFKHISQTEHPWLGFTHHDLSVRWWSVFLYHGFRENSCSALKLLLCSLCNNDIKGPKYRLPFTFPSTFDQWTSKLCTNERVVNYTQEALRDIGMLSKQPDWTGEGNYLSQESEKNLGSQSLCSDVQDNETTFNNDIFDRSVSDLGGNPANVIIRTALKPIINETFSILESLRDPSSNEEFVKLLEDFNSKQRLILQKRKGKIPSGAVIPLAPEEQPFKKQRVFNTKY